MFRPSRILAVLICLFALSTIAVPANAQPPGPIVFNPALLTKTVTVVGAGETLEAALTHALTEIHSKYFLLSYTTANPLCTEVSLPIGNQTSQTFTLCSIEVTARVIRKTLWIAD